jgi:hypothetical protein
MNILISRPSELQSQLNSQRSTPRAHGIGGRSNNCSSLGCEIFVERKFESPHSDRWRRAQRCGDPWRLTIEYTDLSLAILVSAKAACKARADPMGYVFGCARFAVRRYATPGRQAH